MDDIRAQAERALASMQEEQARLAKRGRAGKGLARDIETLQVILELLKR
jgi:hypothetical protein